jgi:hypothetical protein
VFHGVGAVVHFLRKVPWTVPGVTIEGCVPAPQRRGEDPSHRYATDLLRRCSAGVATAETNPTRDRGRRSGGPARSRRW